MGRGNHRAIRPRLKRRPPGPVSYLFLLSLLAVKASDGPGPCYCPVPEADLLPPFSLLRPCSLPVLRERVWLFFRCSEGARLANASRAITENRQQRS